MTKRHVLWQIETFPPDRARTIVRTHLTRFCSAESCGRLSGDVKGNDGATGKGRLDINTMVRIAKSSPTHHPTDSIRSYNLTDFKGIYTHIKVWEALLYRTSANCWLVAMDTGPFSLGSKSCSHLSVASLILLPGTDACESSMTRMIQKLPCTLRTGWLLAI